MASGCRDLSGTRRMAQCAPTEGSGKMLLDRRRLPGPGSRDMAGPRGRHRRVLHGHRGHVPARITSATAWQGRVDSGEWLSHVLSLQRRNRASGGVGNPLESRGGSWPSTGEAARMPLGVFAAFPLPPLQRALSFPWGSLHLSSAQASGFLPQWQSLWVSACGGKGMGGWRREGLKDGWILHSHKAETFMGSHTWRKSPTLCSAKAAGVGGRSLTDPPRRDACIATDLHISHCRTEHLLVGVAGIAGFENPN